MCRCLSFIVLLMMGFLFFFDSEKSLITCACDEIKDVEILVDNFNEKLIQVNADNIDDFVAFLNLQNFKKIKLEDRIIMEGYSNRIKGYIVSNNKKINIQISVGKDLCLVGSPLINGSF